MGKRLLVLRAPLLILLAAVWSVGCTTAQESTIDVTEDDWGTVAFDIDAETQQLAKHEGTLEPLLNSLHRLATDLFVAQGGYRFVFDPQNIEDGLGADGAAALVEVGRTHLSVDFGDATHLTRSDLTLSGVLAATPGPDESMTLEFWDFGIVHDGAAFTISGTVTFQPDLTGTSRSFPPWKMVATSALEIASVGTLDFRATFELASTDEPDIFHWSGRGRFLREDGPPVVDRYGFACSPQAATLVVQDLGRSVASCGGQDGTITVKRSHACTPEESASSLAADEADVEDEESDVSDAFATTSSAQLRWPSRPTGDLFIRFEGFVDQRSRAAGQRMFATPGCGD